MMKQIAVALTLLTLVPACGGSGTPSVQPLSASGFATANSEIARGASFTVPRAIRILGDGENLTLTEQDIRFDILDGTTDVAVTIEGETYRLPLVSNGAFELVDGDNIVVVARRGEPRPEAEILEVFAVVDDRLNASNIVIGFDTDPAEVAARGGAASMTGTVIITARNGFNDGFGDGEFRLTADFNRDSVSGSFDLGNLALPASDFTVPDTSFRLRSAPITGNGFEGTFVQTAGDLGGDLRTATYVGRFFGKDAPSAGGQISAIVDVPGAALPTVIEGAFLVTD